MTGSLELLRLPDTLAVEVEADQEYSSYQETTPPSGLPLQTREKSGKSKELIYGLRLLRGLVKKRL